MRYGAFGLVEVVGSSNAVIVIDQMLKTADVFFLTWNGKCGGHETVFMTGDVSAVTAAVQAVKENPPCEDYFFSFWISNPSEETVTSALRRTLRNTDFLRNRQRRPVQRNKNYIRKDHVRGLQYMFKFRNILHFYMVFLYPYGR